MRKFMSAVVVLLVVTLGLAILAASKEAGQIARLQARITTLERERDDLQAKLLPLERRQRAVLRINQEFVVAQGTVQSYRFHRPSCLVRCPVRGVRAVKDGEASTTRSPPSA